MYLAKLFTVITCQNLVWNVCGMLNFDTIEARSVNRMSNQMISYNAEHTCSLVQQICV